MISLFSNKNVKITILTLGIILFSSFSIKNQWDGVLLISKVGAEYHVFLDRIPDVQDLSIISKINENKKVYDISKKHDIIKIEREENEKGYIAVAKNQQIVSSVKLAKIQFTNNKYLMKRAAYVAAKESTITNNSPIQNEKNVSSDLKSRGEYKETVVTEVNNNEEIIVKEDTSPENNIVEETKVTIVSDLSEYENFLLMHHFIHKVENHENIKMKEDLPLAIAKEADTLDADFEIINNYYSWLHLKDKKSENNFAFDGEYLIEIDHMYFKIQDSNKLLLKSYYVDHDISVKPHNKKWLGIYYKNVLLSEFKTKNGYRIEEQDKDNFIIRIDKHKYNVNCDKEIITITKDGTVIKRININSFKNEPTPYLTN